MERITLKPGKEKPFLHRHPWIFSGAIAKMPSCENGSLVRVESSKGELLGTAYLNRKTSIAARVIAFGDEDPFNAVRKALRNAYALRKELISQDTTCYRLINAEGDFLPGLIVDRYGDYLVFQISTWGMERLKKFVLEELRTLLQPLGIYEKSVSSARKEEGLPPFQKLLHGTFPKSIEVKENGLRFIVFPQTGQKTGFFLDQREMRLYVQSLSKGKKVLNCFAYTGGFSVYALSGGAVFVDSVEISSEALTEAKANCQLNGFADVKTQFYAEDVFEFLRTKGTLDYGLVILDPPAFAKQVKDLIPACRGYKDINRLAIQKMPSNSILITCSCSHFVDDKLFKQVLFQAAAEAKRQVKIIGKQRQAPDHPVSLFHPEGEYLKSLVLLIE